MIRTILVALGFWGFLGMMSCGSSSQSNVDSLCDQYSEAIEERDFDKARSLAEKADRLEGGENNVKYVNEKEVYYLLADNSRNNADRIFYMFNSFEPTQMPDMADVLKVAASQGNEYLGLKLVKGGVKPNEAAINAAVINELNDLLLLIVQKDINSLDNETFMAYAREHQLLKEYAYRYGSVMEEKKLNEFTVDLNNLLSSSISSRPAIGLVKSDRYGNIPSEYIKYNKEAEGFNTKASELVVRAIELNQRSQAQKVIASMKPTLEWRVLGDWTVVVEHTPQYSSVYNAIQVSESKEAIEKAKELLKTH